MIYHPQRGFAILSWVYVGVGALILALAAGLLFQTSRLNKERAAFAQFRGGVAALGEKAKRDAADKALADKLNKENADAENARLRVAVADATKRLRDERARSGGLSAPAPDSSRPELACYNWQEFQRAYGTLLAGIRGIADEGSALAVDLNTAKIWAQQQRRGP